MESRDEAWLHDATTFGQVETDRGTRFGRSQAIREFVLKILSRFSPKFRNFNWVFEPYRCQIRPIADGQRAPDQREKLLLAGVIMRHLQESTRKLRTAQQSRVVVDSSGRIVGSKQTSRQVMPPFRELLSMFGVKRENVPSVEFIEAEIFLTPRILIRTSNQNFFLSQLSDGEKRLFSLFVDIARQLSIHNEAVPFTKVPAIVLIDEVDVHLHPKWQRLIVPSLEDLFPSCQFIATTHSPFVIQGVTESKVQHLNHPLPGDFTDRGIEEIAVKVMGIKDHQVGTRYLELLKTAREYFMLLEKASKTKRDNKSTLRKLKKRLSTLSQTYARNPAYQAYLELHGTLTLGVNNETSE